MNTTAILILVAVVVVGAIFWLVVYSSRSGEKHRQKTSIKPSEPHREEQAG